MKHGDMLGAVPKMNEWKQSTTCCHMGPASYTTGQADHTAHPVHLWKRIAAMICFLISLMGHCAKMIAFYSYNLAIAAPVGQ